jgi:prepilin-type N-terminal cleavage/methylation domain-containing protein
MKTTLTRERRHLAGELSLTLSRRQDAGAPGAAFSLVEVLCAILILGVALVGLTQGLTVALHSSKDSELLSTAALFAAGQIESLRAEGGLENGEQEGDCGEGLSLYRWRQSIKPAGVDGLHEVAVTVENAKSAQPIYELRTLLFEMPDEPLPSAADKRRASRSTGKKGAK